MKVMFGATLMALACLAVGNAQGKPLTEFAVHRPTVIAFFLPVTDADLERDADLNEALADFQLYVTRAAPRLEQAGIKVEVINASEFKIRIGHAVRVFKTGKIGIGYYFIVPGKRPRIEYGVQTDDDIVAIAHDYFKIVFTR